MPRNRENGHGMIRKTGLPTWEMKPRNRHSGNRFEMRMKYNIQLSIKNKYWNTDGNRIHRPGHHWS